MAGTNHMEQFLVLMGNYKKAQEYEKVSENSAGSTDKKYEVYKDKQKILKTHSNLYQQHLLIKIFLVEELLYYQMFLM